MKKSAGTTILENVSRTTMVGRKKEVEKKREGKKKRRKQTKSIQAEREVVKLSVSSNMILNVGNPK